VRCVRGKRGNRRVCHVPVAFRVDFEKVVDWFMRLWYSVWASRIERNSKTNGRYSLCLDIGLLKRTRGR
jgi:hypothetical protein